MKKKISLLIPHDQNKLLYDDTDPSQVEDLAENIITYGQMTPIVINLNNIILSGHRRISFLILFNNLEVSIDRFAMNILFSLHITAFQNLGT